MNEFLDGWIGHQIYQQQFCCHIIGNGMKKVTNWFEQICIYKCSILMSNYLCNRAEIFFELGFQMDGKDWEDHHIWNKWIRTNLSERYFNKVKLPLEWSYRSFNMLTRLRNISEYKFWNDRISEKIKSCNFYMSGHTDNYHF